MKGPKPIYWIFAFFLFIPFIGITQNIYDTLRTIKMTALPNHEAASLTIQWEDDPGINTYSLYKKLRTDTTWGNPLMVSGDENTTYIDTDIEEGELYEYRMIKQTGDSLGYAYLFSGVDYIPPQKKGDILLLIDSIAVDVVEEKLTEYINILISEGWKTNLVLVEEDASVQDIKSLIVEYYSRLDALNTVVLLGNIAVPHSGNINPDAHNNHKGAWPADLYYGDIDGIWTDETVNNTSSVYPRLHNIPGDGNFDQAFIPSDIELAIGRLDFSELPVFDLNEYELLNRYLQKNIDYRTGVYQPKRRAVFKNINPWKEGLGQNAIRNFVPLVAPDSLIYFDFFDAFYDSFLWSYGGSSGSMISSNGLGSINTYADNNFQATFTAYFGSYYGDYDFENNYLRTILGAGKVLSTAWVGAPNWYFHPMGMGMDLGFCTVLTQNNTDMYYAGVFPQSVTINLLGDPTLKAFVVRPPHDLNAVQNANQMELTWSPSEDDILGYQVYKKTDEMDYFEALNFEPILDTNWIDTCVLGEMQLQYLVKAVKREITPSGSFINHSSGPMISIQTHPNILPEADFNLAWEDGVLKVENLSVNAYQYQWLLSNGTSIFEEHFEIPYNENGEITVTLMASNACFSDTLQQTLLISGENNLVENSDILIYPNPVGHSITLETTKYIEELHLYNVLGENVWTETDLAPGSHSIHLEHLTKGTYLLKMRIGNRMTNRMVLLGK